MSNRRKIKQQPQRQVCMRCGRKVPSNAVGWNVVYDKGTMLGNLCPDCQTPEENAEAVINEATIDYGKGVDADGSRVLNRTIESEFGRHLEELAAHDDDETVTFDAELVADRVLAALPGDVILSFTDERFTLHEAIATNVLSNFDRLARRAEEADG